ncbi:hypothetical protein [Bacillus pinisoli]|uniref:hypothetical protein n=1 Tax=Bacillus pinisoli TaxID=2901866 RepID=UPI001FF278DA|nr:hypothetical protein [Bacillus pinisoli]
MIPNIFYLVLDSIFELFYFLGVIIAVGFLIAFIEKYIHTYLFRAFGRRGILITAWIGTPIHEIGHLIQCLLWGHRVTCVKLLMINEPNAVLGFVEHQYNRNSLYQQIGNFFIGIGPVLSGIGTLILGMYVLIPNSYGSFIFYVQQIESFNYFSVEGLLTVGSVVSQLLKVLFTIENLLNPLFWIYTFIGICISSHIALSKQDLKGSLRGVFALFIFYFIIKLVGIIIDVSTRSIVQIFTEINAFLLIYSVIGIIFSLIALFISYCLYFFNYRRGIYYGHKKYPYSR